MTVIEEYWLPIRFRTIREQIEETLASGRKEGEFMVTDHAAAGAGAAQRPTCFPRCAALSRRRSVSRTRRPRKSRICARA